MPIPRQPEDIVLRDLSGDPIGSMFSFTYIKDGPTDPHRPVLFVFNGGPGSSSLWLHMGVIGPEHVVLDRAVDPSEVPPFGLADNPDSVLDTADIVFIDPIGTGYSRIMGQGKPEDFYGVDEDANSVAQFMELWLDKYRRWNSPKFVMGESYGSMRAAILPRALMGGPTYLGMMRGITLNGIVLLGTTLGTHADAKPSCGRGTLGIRRLRCPAMRRRPGIAIRSRPRRAFAGAVLCRRRPLRADRTTWRHCAKQQPARPSPTPSAMAVAAQSFQPSPVFPLRRHPEGPLKLSVRLLPQGSHLAGRGLDLGRYDSRYTLPDAHDGGNEPVADDPAMGQYVPGFVVAAFHEMLTRDLKVTRDGSPIYAIHWRGLLEKWNWKRERVAPGQNAATDSRYRHAPQPKTARAGGRRLLRSHQSCRAEALHDINAQAVCRIARPSNSTGRATCSTSATRQSRSPTMCGR